MLELVTGNVEVRPQYGETETKILGIFDSNLHKDIAIKLFEDRYRNYQTLIIVTEVIVNKQLGY